MHSPYLLLTACRNEAAHIGECIRSVIDQTRRPVRWLINDDGSTDDTFRIAQELAATVDFIEVRQLERSGGRSFGAQYRALSAAYEQCGAVPHEYVSFLDGDIALERDDYFERLLAEFAANPRLGIGGGYVMEPQGGVFSVTPGNARWTVAGGVQTFRRKVFQEIGGYVPLELGGSDTLAELRARMAGWHSESFPRLRVRHFRPASSADGYLRGLYKGGRMDASFGYHPLYAFSKFLRRLPQRPYLAGSVARLAGYCAARLSGERLTVPAEVASFVRREQMERLGNLLPGILRGRAAATEPLATA
jgi:biofilm PGA synthesis N-glycosyltransferase PgaC